MRGFRRGALDHHVQAFFLRPRVFLFERLLAVVIDGQVADDLEQVADCALNDEVICGADWSLKNASWTTSSARERQPVMRAAIFTRIVRLSTNAWRSGVSHLRVDSCSDMEITLLRRAAEHWRWGKTHTWRNKLC